MPRVFAAIAAGRDTYPHFENTNSGRMRERTDLDWKKPAAILKGSMNVFHEKYLRSFPDLMGKNSMDSPRATFSSRESDSPIQ